MRYYLDKADAQKVKKIQQSLKKADLELVKIERANKKTKDPVVAKKVKESRSRIKKVLLTLGKWGLGVLGMGATIAGLTLEMYGIAKGIEWVEDRANRRRREQRAQVLEQEAQNRFNQYRLEHGRPPANGGNGPRVGNPSLGILANGEDRMIAQMAAERAAERAAARETAQAANNANMAIGQAQDAIRELDLDNRPGGPVNSPGDQGARFGGLDLDAGYKVRRPQKYRVVTHDSMPWSK